MRTQDFAWLASLVIAIGIAGCESTLQSGEPSPARAPSQTELRPMLGGIFEVAHFQATSDYTPVVVDRSGVGHVIIAMKESHEVQHILVGPDGVLGRESVVTGVKSDSLDAAFDSSGSLHILIEGEHYAKVDGAWRGGIRTPWMEARLEPRGRGFVPGGRDLIWRFMVAGEEVGAPGRWDLIAGYNFVFPWRSHGWKLMFVPDASPTYTSWLVLDPHDNSAVDGYWTASDADGIVTLLYKARGSGLRYAHFDTKVEPATATEAARMKGGQALRAVRAAPSRMPGQLAWMAGRQAWDFAAAPDGATRLFVQRDGELAVRWGSHAANRS